MLRFAYNTTGCTAHRLDDALELIAEAGYQGAAIGLDWHHLDPMSVTYEADAEALRKRLDALDLAVTVDTATRFSLDPRAAYEPTLLHPTEEGRAQRLDYIRRGARIANILSAESLIFVAGRPSRKVSEANAGAWLLDGLKQVADICAEHEVLASLDPCPGHLVGTLDDFKLVREALKQMTDAPLGLTLDMAHVMTLNDREPHQAVKEFSAILGAVSLSDGKRGEHNHFAFGEGEMDVTSVLGALDDVGYSGLVTVDLPRDSHRAHDMIPQSYDFIQDKLPSD